MDELNPYAAPQAVEEPVEFAIESDPTIVRVGAKLLVPEGALLPTRCVGCNQATSIEYKNLVAPASPVWLMITVIACALGSSLCILLIDWSGWQLGFLLLPVTFASLVAISFTILRGRGTSFTFYICAKHRMIRYSLAAVWSLFYLPFLGSHWLEEQYGFVIDHTYSLGIVGLLILYSLIFIGQHAQPVGKKSKPGLFEFRGFGKKYLESFPSGSDRSEHVG